MTLTKDFNLTNNEKRILLSLSKKDRFSPDNLAAASELSIEAAMQSAFMLAEKGLCEIKETVTTTYNLTKEGEQYAQILLPERQVMNSLK
ncbi:MAG: phenylalanine--tRNA ligase subunit alpha, partial [Candidatus Methanoperedens sp.]|nr:phenylalanine--tRNA ligase subunit alpha [Candidatus Methanoperedens sp.]